MSNPIIDTLRLVLQALYSMLRSPSRLPRRSWLTELNFRLVKNLLAESRGKPISWLRQRQAVLKIVSPAMRRVSFTPAHTGGVPGQWCRPKTMLKPERIVVYFHGGGYVFGAVDCHRNTLAALALRSDAAVLGVDYRLGPEHPFPAAHEDCLAACRQVLADNADIPVVLAGDSAGGALAIATYLALLDTADTQTLPCALALISPWVDPGNSQGSIFTHAGSDVLEREMIEDWFALYANDTDHSDPRLNFTRANLAHLPPTLIQAAGGEILIDQIHTFAAQAKQQGAQVSLDIYADQFHVFQTFAPLVADAGPALEKMGEFIRMSH
jgi:acetyl esterase/lipase